MKSERRHELQHHALEDWLGNLSAKIAPYSNLMLAGVIVLVVGISGWFYFRGQSARRSEAAWTSFARAQTGSDPRADLLGVASTYPKEEAGQWALFNAAQDQLQVGVDQLFKDRTAANEDLHQAQENFEKVISTANQLELRQLATLNLAKTFESLVELDKAREQYQKCVTEFPGTAVAQIAEARIKSLEQTSTLEFYEWFANLDPSKPVGSQPGGTPGIRPSTDLDSILNGGSGGSGAGGSGAGESDADDSGLGADGLDSLNGSGADDISSGLMEDDVTPEDEGSSGQGEDPAAPDSSEETADAPANAPADAPANP